jgi:hypothetical protein
VALTDDQKAMLRLLAQRGEEGYEDMAALMGISVEEVRKRVSKALAEAAKGDPAVESPSVPKPAPPVSTPTPPPAKAEEPPVVVEPVAAPVPAQPPARAKRARKSVPSLRLPKDRGALIGLGAGALVVLIFAIVLIVSGGGSGSDSSTTSGAETSGGGTNTSAAESNLTQAILSPTDGGNASGRALFGSFKKKVLLQVTAEGLEPLPDGEMYTVWLYRSPKIALQIGAAPVDQAGKLAAQFEIPAKLLTYVANGSFNQVDVARTSVAAYKAAFAKAKRENRVPPYVGSSVLRGEITSPALRSQ